MLNSLRKKFYSGSPFSQVATLSSGTAFAQAIGLLSTPILSRLYTEPQFAILASFISWFTVLITLACGRFNIALISEKDDESAFHLERGAALVNLSVFLILTLIVESLPFIFPSLKQSKIWMQLLPIAVLLSGFYQIQYAWHVRSQKYKNISKSYVLQTFITNFVQIFLGYLQQATGLFLIWGSILGQLSSWLYLLKPPYKPQLQLRNSWQKTLRVLQAHLSFLLFSTPSSAITISSRMLPGLSFPFLFASKDLGFIFLAFKASYFPTVLISQSVSQVLYRKASDAINTPLHVRNMLRRTYQRLLFICIPPTILLIVFAPDLFAFIFGENWRVAGEFQRILLPWFSSIFVFFPAQAIFDLLKRQKTLAFLNFAILILQLSGLTLCSILEYSTKTACIILSILGLLANILPAMIIELHMLHVAYKKNT